MAQRRAIGERLRRTKSLETRREIVLDWGANWYADHLATIHNLEKALQHRDVESAGRYCGQLKALHEKALGALPRVVEALCDDDIL